MPNRIDMDIALRQVGKEKKRILVLEKAFAIQEQLADYPQGISLNALATRVKLNRSTVYRILDTLNYMGYIVKKTDGKYRLGYKYYELSQSVLDVELKRVVFSYMHQLSKEVDEIVHLSIEENNEIVYIEEIDTNAKYSVTIKSFLGKRGYLHSTAAGKAYLASLADKKIEGILAQTGIRRRTKNTIIDICSFMQEIHQIRKQGYAVDDSEDEDNIRSVAASITDIHGVVIGIIDIAGTVFSVTRETLPKLGLMVKECTANISAKINFQTARNIFYSE